MNVPLPLGCVLGDKLSLLKDVIAPVCILNCSLSVHNATELAAVATSFVCIH